MKPINKLCGIFGALCVLLGFSACTEEADYTPAELLANAQVYFPTTMPEQVDLKNDATSFVVELHRVKTDEAATVSLSAVDESKLFTIPTSASFAAGENVANITISYDPAVLGFDSYKAITLAIADETYTTPYGTGSYSFKAGIPSPWTSLGMATFTDTFIFGGSYQVELQQNELDPSSYRLVDPYSEALEKEAIPTKGEQSPYLVFKVLKVGDKLNDIDITIDGLVHFTSACTGFYNTSSDYNTNVDIHHPSDFAKFQTEDIWKFSCVKLRKESDNTPAIVQLAPFYYMEGIGGWDNTQKNGMITIVFPGVVIKDYSAKVVYNGRFTNVGGDNFAVANITLGKDVETAKVAMVEGDDINAAVSGILNGSLETIDVTASGTVNILSNNNGLSSIVVVTYADGEEQEAGFASFEFSAGTNRWNSLGMATYTDDIVGPAYEEDPIAYNVEIQENATESGIYRLVNPYGEAFPYNKAGDWDASKNYYLVINAQDPEGVYIDMQNTGLNWGNGNFYVYSMAANYLAGGKSLEEIKALGVCGSLVDGVITFPAKALLFGFIEEGDDLYYANNNGAFKVILPGTKNTPQAKNRMTVGKTRVSSKTLQKGKAVSEKQLRYGLATSAQLLK